MLSAFGYTCYWHFHYIFNPQNFHSVQENHFGGIRPKLQVQQKEQQLNQNDTRIYGPMSLNMLCTHTESALAKGAKKEIDRMGLMLANEETIEAYSELLVTQQKERYANT